MERLSSIGAAERPGFKDVKLGKTRMRAPFNCIRWFLLMASVETVEGSSQVKNGSTPKRCPNVDLSARP